MAVLLIDCGMSTLKSPLLRESDAPRVHPRLRKRLARCTLDCGFKTSESPALRGFVGGLRALATAALYLVLKSNGLRHSKNSPVKFGFSPKIVPAYIVKKLPSQRCPPTTSHPDFQLLAQTVHVRSHSRKWVHTRPSEKNRTQRLTRRNRGLPSLDHSAALCRQRNTLYSATLLYTYISRFSVNPQHQQKRKIWQSCCHKFYPPTVFHPAFQLLAQMAHVCFHGRKRVHARLCQQDRTQRPTRRNRGRFRWGGIATLGAFHTFRKPCVAGYQNGVLCRFWALVGGALEEHRKSSEQRCAYACRCPEGVATPLGCVIQ